jgi:hypothetical protein
MTVLSPHATIKRLLASALITLLMVVTLNWLFTPTPAGSVLILFFVVNGLMLLIEAVMEVTERLKTLGAFLPEDDVTNLDSTDDHPSFLG